MVDFNATYLNIGGYTEAGSASNLTVDGASKTILSVSPAIEFGGQYKLANGTLVRPYTKAGVTFFGDNNVTTTAHFVSDAAGSSFDVIATSDRTFADFSSGVDMLAADGMTVRLNTDSHFGTTTRDISASAKVGWKF